MSDAGQLEVSRVTAEGDAEAPPRSDLAARDIWRWGRERRSVFEEP